MPIDQTQVQSPEEARREAAMQRRRRQFNALSNERERRSEYNRSLNVRIAAMHGTIRVLLEIRKETFEEEDIDADNALSLAYEARRIYEAVEMQAHGMLNSLGPAQPDLMPTRDEYASLAGLEGGDEPLGVNPERQEQLSNFDNEIARLTAAQDQATIPEEQPPVDLPQPP